MSEELSTGAFFCVRSTESRVLFCYYPSMITNPLVRFLIFWGFSTLSLWVADELFDSQA